MIHADQCIFVSLGWGRYQLKVAEVKSVGYPYGFFAARCYKLLQPARYNELLHRQSIAFKYLLIAVRPVFKVLNKVKCSLIVGFAFVALKRKGSLYRGSNNRFVGAKFTVVQPPNPTLFDAFIQYKPSCFVFSRQLFVDKILSVKQGVDGVKLPLVVYSRIDDFYLKAICSKAIGIFKHHFEASNGFTTTAW